MNVMTRRGAGPGTAEPFGAVGSAGYNHYGFTSHCGNDRVASSLTADRRYVDNVYGRESQMGLARLITRR